MITNSIHGTPRPKFATRQQRVLDALWVAKGWIWRETLDRIAKASNGPEVISKLRHRRGIDIDMQQVDILDSDGIRSRPGRYRLTEKGRSTLLSMGWIPTRSDNG
jgi:hypothetical protein